MGSRNITLVSSLGLRIGPACEAGLSAGMRRERVSPQIRKKEGKTTTSHSELLIHIHRHDVQSTSKAALDITSTQLSCRLLNWRRMYVFYHTDTR